MSHDQLPVNNQGMPSTSETVEVPAQHRIDSETGMSPRATEVKAAVEAKRKRNVLFASVGGGLALLAAGVAGGLAVGGGDKAPAPKAPEASAPAVAGGEAETPDITSPEPTQTPSETVAPIPADREPNIYDMSTLSEEEYALAESMDKMSVEDFSAMPLKQRLIYVIERDHQVMSEALFSEFFNQQLNDGSSLSQHSITFAPLNKFSNGAEIAMQSSYAEQLTAAWKVDENAIGDGELDVTTASKLVSGYALDPKSPIYESIVGSIQNSSVVGRFNDTELNGEVVTKTSEPVPAANPIDESETIERTLTVQTKGQTLDVTYRFIPMEEQLGEGNGLWLRTTSSEF